MSAPSDATLAAEPERPTPRQRLGAYVLCIRGEEVLLTRLSDTTGRAGWWTLPGGGIEHGEHPETAALRETHEETGLIVTLQRFLTLDNLHFVGRSPAGVLEDYHSIRLVFSATCEDNATPRVLDVGGSSDDAAWVALNRLSERDDGGGVPVVSLVTAALAAQAVSGSAD